MITIKMALNGYIVEEENHTFVYEEEIDVIRHIADMLSPGSRHDEKRIYVIEAPGDKNESFTEEHANVIWGQLNAE